MSLVSGRSLAALLALVCFVCWTCTGVRAVSVGDVDEALPSFRPHYRKLPRLPLHLLLDHVYAKRVDRFDREDRDYKPLMFGKRGSNNDYMPPLFG